MAEVLERLGRKEEAVQEYRKVAEGYATEGFLLQAISVNKVILRINPSLKDVNERLAQLYTEKYHEAQPHHPFPQIPLFSELQDQELQSLVSQVCVKTFKNEETICQDGDPGDSLMIISRGEVGIFKEAPTGKEALVRSLKEGNFFGEFGFFTDHKRHATVKALTEAEVFEISREGLNEIISAHPRIHEVLYDLYKHRVLDLFLSVSPLFASLSGPERDEVFKRFQLISVPVETLIFNGGDPPGFPLPDQKRRGGDFTQTRQGKRIQTLIERYMKKLRVTTYVELFEALDKNERLKSKFIKSCLR
jgi:cAMP-dependent protein kinase regulator